MAGRHGGARSRRRAPPRAPSSHLLLCVNSKVSVTPPSALPSCRPGDPASAARLSRNDFYRLERALEVVQSTGRPMEAFLPSADGAAAASPFDFRCGDAQGSGGSRWPGGAAAATEAQRGSAAPGAWRPPAAPCRPPARRCFHLQVPRLELYRRIDLRCEAMARGPVPLSWEFRSAEPSAPAGRCETGESAEAAEIEEAA